MCVGVCVGGGWEWWVVCTKTKLNTHARLQLHRNSFGPIPYNQLAVWAWGGEWVEGGARKRMMGLGQSATAAEVQCRSIDNSNSEFDHNFK